MKIKISKSQWEKIGREAGWNIATQRRHERMLNKFSNELRQIMGWSHIFDEPEFMEKYPALREIYKKLSNVQILMSQVINFIKEDIDNVLKVRNKNL